MSSCCSNVLPQQSLIIPEYSITNEAGLVVALNDLNNVVVLRTPIRKPVDTGTNKGSRIRSTTQPDSYKKDKLWQLSMDTQAAFSKLYAFCFALAKPEYVTSKLLFFSQ